MVGGSVRHDLVAATTAAHQDLHVHPWISCLTCKDLSLSTYAIVLGAYCAFFDAIERRRNAISAFDDLSLAPQISAMHHDLARMNHHARAAETMILGNSPMAILGALYALHGAGFGAKMLHIAIKNSLPDAPCQYFALGTSPLVWRDLTARLETAPAKPADRSALFEGATQTFIQFGTFVSAYCAQTKGADPTSRNLQ